MTVYTWIAGTSGDWSTPADWKLGAVPGSLDLASFGGPGSYLVTINSGESIAGLALAGVGATLDVNVSLTVGGTLNVTGGTLDVRGTLSDATVKIGAAGTLLIENYATLSDVTYDGSLAVTGSNQLFYIANNFTMAGASGTGAGTLLLAGDYAQLYFTTPTQTVDNATIDIGAVDAGAYTQIVQAYSFEALLLTFGPHTLIAQTGAQATITTNDALNTITNQGTIESELAGGTLTVNGGGTFSNAGTIIVGNFGTLLESVGSFSNTGTIIETSGVLSIASGTTTAGLGNIVRTGGTLVLGGTVDNTGATLSVGAGAALGTVTLAGTIVNGVVHDQGGGLLLQAGAALSGVTYRGALTLADYAQLSIQNGLTLTGAGGTGVGVLTATGLGDSINLSGAAPQTLDNLSIKLGNTSYTDTLNVSGTAKLGTHVVLTQSGLNAQIGGAGTLINTGTIVAGLAGGTFNVQSGTFDNAGLITVGNGDALSLQPASLINTGRITVTTGGVLTLGAPLGTVANTGKVTVDNGRVNLGGTAITAAQIAAITRTGTSTLDIAGKLDLFGKTLNLGAGSALGSLELTGMIQDGIIHDAGGGLQFQGLSYTPSVLANVTYEGTLNLSAPSSILQVTGSFGLTGAAGTGAGFIDLTGAGSTLTLVGSNTLDNVTIDIGGTPVPGASGNATATLAVTPVNSATPFTLTLGAHASVVQTGQTASIASSYYAGESVLNLGSISAGASGGLFSLTGQTFDNLGVISVANGDTLQDINSLFVNAGTVAVTTGGVLMLNGTWTNTGVISENAGTVVLNSALVLSQLGQIKRTGGSVVIGGALSLGGATLNVGTGSALGNYVVSGSIANGVVHDAGGGLLFGSSGQGASVGNLTYDGTLVVGAARSGTLAVAGTLLDTGGLVLKSLSGTGPGALVLNGGSLATSLLFNATQTLDNATITMAGSSSTIGFVNYNTAASIVTFGSKLTITQTGSTALLDSYQYSGSYYYLNSGMVNDGTINAGLRHGSFEIYGPSFTNNGVINVSNGDDLVLDPTSLTNTGTISVTNGGVVQFDSGVFSDTGKIIESNSTVLLYGPLTIASIAAITRTGGMIEIGGTLDLGATVLNVGSGSASGSLSLVGRITDGTIHDAGGGMQFYGAYLGQTYYGQSGTLDGITYRGVLDLRTSYSTLTISDGLTLTGISGTGAGVVSLTGAGSQLTFLDSQTFDNATITIGNTALVSTLNFSDASSDGETLTLGAHLLLNTRAGLSQIQSTRALGDTILNMGTVQDMAIGAKLTVFGGTFDNAGIIDVANSATMFLEPDTLVNAATGTIEVGGGGDLVLGAAGGSGGFKILAGGTLDFSDTAGAGVVSTFASAGGVLQLESASGYAGKIAGFAIGATIDLVGVASGGTTAAISGTTLTVTEGAGPVLHLALVAAPTGKLVVGSDGRGGTNITLTTAAVAKMAFIPGAGGTGSFTGTAAGLSGHTLQGFVSGDQVDVTDLSFAASVLKIANGPSATTLGLTGNGLDAHFTLAGSFMASAFHTAADGHGGTAILYHP